MNKLTPCLWFEGQAEEAANFYVSVFKNSKITDIAYYDDETAVAAGIPKGSVLTVLFKLDGHEFMGLNGGPAFKFTPAISFMIDCNDQEEVDYFWDKLSEGGRTDQCGWLTDKYGVSWQVVPTILIKNMTDKDPARSQRVFKAMLKMTKLIVKDLEDAYEGE
jgi:predicted 3-demethylubiquinone-9 3-methyltransferase (glyoxalase superfamily)